MTDPPPTAGTEMTKSDIDALLEGVGHGVLSMGVDSRGYGLPITYWYDPSDRQFILGFLLVPDSKKTEFVTESEEVTLTVFNFEDIDAWESAIVTGTLERLTDPEVPDRFSTLFFVREEDNPGGKTAYNWGQYDRAWYEIDIEDISGRYSGPGTLE
jgi:nitroimidazol reductase NimA-like FMN-containing flavoprotein (pyridoxamine 5'-phosphate oxidase superfamily)